MVAKARAHLFTAPAPAAKARVRLFTSPGVGSAFFDAVRLEELP